MLVLIKKTVCTQDNSKGCLSYNLNVVFFEYTRNPYYCQTEYLLGKEEMVFSYDVFFNLCESTGITPYRVAKDTGIASTTFSEWKKHCETGGQQGYVPKYDKIVAIAQYFDVRPESFFSKEV